MPSPASEFVGYLLVLPTTINIRHSSLRHCRLHGVLLCVVAAVRLRFRRVHVAHTLSIQCSVALVQVFSAVIVVRHWHGSMPSWAPLLWRDGNVIVGLLWLAVTVAPQYLQQQSPSPRSNNQWCQHHFIIISTSLPAIIIIAVIIVA